MKFSALQANKTRNRSQNQLLTVEYEPVQSYCAIKNRISLAYLLLMLWLHRLAAFGLQLTDGVVEGQSLASKISEIIRLYRLEYFPSKLWLLLKKAALSLSLSVCLFVCLSAIQLRKTIYSALGLSNTKTQNNWCLVAGWLQRSSGAGEIYLHLGSGHKMELHKSSNEFTAN